MLNTKIDVDQAELSALQRSVEQMNARFKVIVGGVVAAAVAGALLWAPIAMSEPSTPVVQEYDDLYTFEANTPAVAVEVNSNFSTLHGLVDLNTAAIGTNAQAIVALGSSSIDGSRVQNGTITADKLAGGAVNTQVRDYIRANCKIYIGWRDSCNNCSAAPSRWGGVRVNGGACTGSGGETNCGNPPWVGIGMVGDVDGNDTFYVAFNCD